MRVVDRVPRLGCYGLCQSPLDRGLSAGANDFTDEAGDIEDQRDPAVAEDCRAGDSGDSLKLSAQWFDYGLTSAVQRIDGQSSAGMIDFHNDYIFALWTPFGQLEPVAETNVR